MNKSGYLQRQKARDHIREDAIRVTYEQYMMDTLMLTLNNPEVMGKDVFGHKRLKKLLDAWGATYDTYFDALTKRDEADYMRAKMDERLAEICRGTEDFIPFEKRYDWLPKISYEPKKKQH